MGDSFYDVAQICQNGHVVNFSYRAYPAHNQEYCDKCGAKTTTQCAECQASIRGTYHVPGVFSIGEAPRAPAFCFKCGKPFPWTAERLAAARELVETFDKLSGDEKKTLAKTLDDIIRETPRSQPAMAKFKILLSKAGHEAADALRKLLIDMVSDTVRKTVLGA